MGDLWNTTVQLPTAVNIIICVILVVLALAGLYFVWLRGRAAGFNMRWSTQDILVLAIMGVLLEVYDNLIGDQFVSPIIKAFTGPAYPIVHDFALNDLPYMFLLMVGIALIRKPFVATSLVFLNFLLMQLLFPGDKSSVLWWPYGIYQGLLVDMYVVLRGKHIFETANLQAFWDGLVMGAVRAVPAVTISSAILGPLLTGSTDTFGNIFLNGTFNWIGNGLEAAITAGLAIYVAHSVSHTSTHEVVAQEAVAQEAGVAKEGSAS
jgi:hypothetical protein